ncbi:protoporphyrinogen oxidase [Silvibacterium acidisoli]|uniref:protoporphyrinogen oxidase n=1 Tax=Acidobacteriaceae bacterium ZG23-2 TaxID=2883246 RepID=UPI00406BEBF2
MKRTAIIGGGIAGVAAAYELARRNQPFVLFEASHRLGGIVETLRRDGFVVECGPDSWVSEKPWARELAVGLGLEAEIIPSNDSLRKTYLLQQSKLVPMPDGMRMMVPTKWEPILQSPLFSEEARRAYQLEPARAEELKANALAEEQDESVASFVSRHFGEEATRTIAGPLLSGVFGGNIDTLSVRATMPAFVKMEREHGSLVIALQQKPARESQPLFTTLKSGLETLIERVAATLPAGSVRLQHPVESISRSSGQWHVNGELFDHVILATPAHITRKLIEPIQQECSRLLKMEATSAIVVALAFAPDQAKNISVPGGFGYLVPPDDATISFKDPQLLACTFVDQKFTHRAPDGAVLLRAFFGGETAAAILDKPDGFLIAAAHRQLSRSLGLLPEPTFTVLRRWPLSLPQYAVGHVERMAHLKQLVQTVPGLQLIGNAYHGVGLPDLVRQGREAAARIAQDLA